MATTCKNCNDTFEGKYCNNCGQPAETKRIDFHVLGHDIMHAFLHFDRGISFTLKELFTRPGHAIRDYLQGKRIRHFKPITMVIVLAGIYGFLYHYFDINPFYILNRSNESFIGKMNEWRGTHYAITQLISLPLISIASFLAFRKSNYNLAEHLILNAFIIGQRLMVGLVLFPAMIIFNGKPEIAIVGTISSILSLLLLRWDYVQFFNDQSSLQASLKTLLVLLVVIIEIIILTSIIWIFAHS